MKNEFRVSHKYERLDSVFHPETKKNYANNEKREFFFVQLIISLFLLM